MPVHGMEDNAADLDALRNKLADVLEANGNGPLHIDNVNGKLSLNECSEAIKLEWAHMPKSDLEPGMPQSDLKRCRDQLPKIKFVRRMISVWKAIRSMLDKIDIEASGHIYIEGGSVKVRGISSIRERWQCTTLIIDATLPDIEILRAYYPQVEIVGDWMVEMPHVKVRQYVNAPVSQGRLYEDRYGS